MSRRELAIWHLREAVKYGNPSMIARCRQYAAREGVPESEIRKELLNGG